MTDGQRAGSNGQESNDETNQRSASEREGMLEMRAPNQGGNTGELLIGQKLGVGDNPEYTIVEKLGSGGFGITYLAKDRQGNKVAIKTIKKELRSNPDFNFEKFKADLPNEALRLGKCQNHHIVKVYKNIVHEELPCIVMEYIPGKGLDKWVMDRPDFLPEEEALKYIRQIGEALICVHSQDPPILHRDVKPTNIIIRENGENAVLIDFGIARELNPDVQFSTILATPRYAPLEQYSQSQPQGTYTDVYALAATLYFMLTKEVPEHAGNRGSQVLNQNEDTLKPPKEINPNISDTVNKAILQGMSISTRERPQTIQDFLNLLQSADTNSESRPADSNAEKASLSLQQNKETQQNNQLLIRTGVMGAGFWWLAVALLKITAGFSGVTLIVGLIFLVCSQIKINITAEDRIYQLVFAFIPTMGILLGIWQANLPILPIYSIVLMPLISGVLASFFMWLLRKITALLN